MTFVRPSLTDLISRVESDIQTRLGTGPLTAQSVLGVLARVLAGTAHMQHGHVDWAALQAFPHQATDEYLEQWADVWGITRKAAIAARGPALFTGAPGAKIPAGTFVQRADGARFFTQQTVVIGGTNEGPAVLQAETAGLAGNTPAATQLVLSSPISGVVSTLTVSSPGLAGGTDLEDDADLRSRLLQVIRKRPMGGAARDYVAWALEVPKITRAWCLPSWLGAGTVGVVIVTDDEPDGIIPDQDKVDEVAAYIDERRPVTADVTVIAPTPVPIDFSLAIVPDTTTLRTDVTAALKAALEVTGGPGGSVLLSALHEAISTTPGESDHVIYAPTTNVPIGTTEVATVGTVSFV